MLFYSTKNQSLISEFKEAAFLGPASDGGLFMPTEIPILSGSFFQNIGSLDLPRLGSEVLFPYIGLTRHKLDELCDSAFNFPAPLHHLADNLQVLELFHGPTLAFKDFGARFMARVMAYFKPADTQINILVATSGDTGGAVASAFSGLEGFNVYILFPKGKVSPLQQRQLTTWETNIKAIEVGGNFDDCQRLVKMAFADDALRRNKVFASANSINIARLLPQMIYYFEAYKQAINKHGIQFIVPSGNFGNLTAGLVAKHMGLPVSRFIAATNINDTVPQYLSDGIYDPKVSRETLSNAMDVGDPSNFSRMLALYRGQDESSTWNNMTRDIKPVVVNDATTLDNIREVYDKYGYLIDPHTAVAYEAAKTNPGNNIIVSTAHWAKFEKTIHQAIGTLPSLPEALTSLLNKKENMSSIDPDYGELKEILTK